MFTLSLMIGVAVLAWWIGVMTVALAVVGAVSGRGHLGGVHFRRWALKAMFDRDRHGTLFGWFFHGCGVFRGDEVYRSYWSPVPPAVLRRHFTVNEPAGGHRRASAD